VLRPLATGKGRRRVRKPANSNRSRAAGFILDNRLSSVSGLIGANNRGATSSCTIDRFVRNKLNNVLGSSAGGEVSAL
jgi:hypothetical protein